MQNPKGEYMTRRFLIASVAVALVILALVSIAYAASLTIQAVTDKMSYVPGKPVTIKASATNGSLRIKSKDIYTATVTIKDPSGKTLVSGKAMSKDTNTGLCFYTYTLSSGAPKGEWTASVYIKDKSGNTGIGASTFNVKGLVPDHKAFMGTYEGTKTCIACHSKQANDMFGSVHYQWKGDSSKAIELAQAGSDASKLGGINDFCIWPDGNWLTVFNKLDGTTGPGGCAVCHAGLGKKPTPTVSTEQLENIDCLICHSPTYKRTVAKNADGTFSLVPDSSIDIQAAAKNITRPTRAICMRCHQNSGGGNNYKRGDLESTIISCSKSYDVHMGTDGQDFVCQDCHKTENHRMAGRGSDMRALDSSFKLSCEACHTQIPHRSYNANYADLNRHTDKVDCTVCHIPSFAKSVPTDMHRNWGAMEADTGKQLYDPEITKASNVMPVYAWFNGFSHFYRFKDPVSLDERGVQKMSWPDGGFVDSGGKHSKLYAFKLHSASQPMENATKQLLPVKNKIAFETGNVEEAIRQGAVAAGMSYASHSFVSTERYMGIFHTVGPKSTALSCSNQPCHGNESRIPFGKLGYERRGSNAQLCDVCHSLKSSPGFTSLHSKHSSRKNCTACHGAGNPLNASKSTLCSKCHSYNSESDPNKIHAKHVKDKKYDCKNCHTFSGDPREEGHGEEYDD